MKKNPNRRSRCVAVLGFVFGIVLFGAGIVSLLNTCVTFHDVSTLNTRRVWTPKKEDVALVKNEFAQVVAVGRRETYNVFTANFSGEKRYLLIKDPHLPEALVLIEDQRELSSLHDWEHKFGGHKVFFQAPSKFRSLLSFSILLIFSSVALLIVVGSIG